MRIAALSDFLTSTISAVPVTASSDLTKRNVPNDIPPAVTLKLPLSPSPPGS